MPNHVRHYVPGAFMYRMLLSLGLFVIAWAVVLIFQGPAEALPRGGAGKRPAFKTIGVGSCAAAACHHGNNVPETKGSEYSTFVALDPHAKAYSALFKPESKRMHEILARDDASLLKGGAHRNPLCLKCHGAGDGVREELQADGVGCERCHGPAERWKNTHYQGGFTGKEPGFVDLGKLSVRVEVCMACHVGEPDMEVDHDLIAAGHPRLRFEFAAYYSTYPRHWDQTRRSRPQSATQGNDLEVRGWALGQIVAARVASELLAHRAAKKPDSWPEYAEYDCAACHHGLRPGSFRTERDLALVKPGVTIPLGRLPWGSWYYPLLGMLADGTPSGEKAKLTATLLQIEQHMKKRLPPGAKVSNDALALAKILRNWESQVARHVFEPAEVRKLLQFLQGQETTVKANWDGGAQVYLGLAAAHYQLKDLDADFVQKTRMVEKLTSMRKILAGAYPGGPEARPRYDVPAKYKPLDLLQSIKQLSEEAR